MDQDSQIVAEQTVSPAAGVRGRRALVVGVVAIAVLLAVAVYALVPGSPTPEASGSGSTPGPSSHPATQPISGTASSSAAPSSPAPSSPASSSDPGSGQSGSGLPAPWPLPPGGPGPVAPVRPATPSGITVTAASTSTLRVRWTDNAQNETGYVVVHQQTTMRVILGADATGYDWGGFNEGVEGCFAVAAYNGAGWSIDTFPPQSSSDWTCAWTHQSMPAAPSNPSATGLDADTIRLSWADNSFNESGFQINWADGSHQWIYDLLASKSQTSLTVDHAFTIEVSTTYCFRIRAYNSGAGEPYFSAWSAWACTSTLPLPAKPGSAVLTTVSDTVKRIEWTDSSAIETGYRIYKAGSGVSHDLPANSTSYEWTGLTPGVPVCFIIRAIAGTVASAQLFIGDASNCPNN